MHAAGAPGHQEFSGLHAQTLAGTSTAWQPRTLSRIQAGDGTRNGAGDGAGGVEDDYDFSCVNPPDCTHCRRWTWEEPVSEAVVLGVADVDGDNIVDVCVQGPADATAVWFIGRDSGMVDSNGRPSLFFFMDYYSTVCSHATGLCYSGCKLSRTPTCQRDPDHHACTPWLNCMRHDWSCINCDWQAIFRVEHALLQLRFRLRSGSCHLLFVSVCMHQGLPHHSRSPAHATYTLKYAKNDCEGKAVHKRDTAQPIIPMSRYIIARLHVLCWIVVCSASGSSEHMAAVSELPQSSRLQLRNSTSWLTFVC